MHVNNETGVVQPVAEIAEALTGRDVFMHVDAAQGYGKEIEALRHPRIDLISASGHKIYGPKGIGVLIARRRRFEYAAAAAAPIRRRAGAWPSPRDFAGSLDRRLRQSGRTGAG